MQNEVDGREIWRGMTASSARKFARLQQFASKQNHAVVFVFLCARLQRKKLRVKVCLCLALFFKVPLTQVRARI